MRAQALAGALAAASAVLVLASCGGNDATSPPPAGAPAPGSAQQQAPDQHNQADIKFAQMMIVHHTQAIEMARLAQDRAQSPQVKDLARRIEQAQGPEIATMTAWLRAWNANVPATGMDQGSMPGMDHGAMPGMDSGAMGPGMMGPGMMDPEQMSQLEQAAGAQFDRQFLQMMIKHHEGAIAMARAELATGQNPKAKQLAQQIITDQQSEIQEMQKLLSQL